MQATLFIPAGFFKAPAWDVLSHFLRVQAIRPFDTELLRWEWISLAAACVLCISPWIIPGRFLRRARYWFHAFAQNRARAIWAAFLFPMVIRVALLPAVPIKPPSVHDEFSLLLMADTFRSGRLTNPTPPYWTHFETIHVIQRPTYNSMYPPGFGAFLSVGQLLGDPWLGVLLTAGLMSGAFCWMLQGWLPPAWALGGALIIVLQTGVGSYWMNSYVGGATVPAAAGALLVGAIPRFLKKPASWVAVVFAIGVVFQVNTRPFEGTILSVLCFCAAILWRLKGTFGRPLIPWRTLAPAFLVLLAGGVFTAYYSWRVTGDPLKTAYVVNRETYGWPENLAILPPRQLTYRHKILESMHVLELSRRERYTTLGRMLNSWCARAAILWEFYVGPGLTAALLFLPWTLRNRKLRWLFYIAAIVTSLNVLQLMAYPQHVSAQMVIFAALLTAGFRQLYVFTARKGIQPERAMTAIVLAVAAGAMSNLFMDPLHIRPGSFWEWPHWPFFEQRARIASKIEHMPGKHLVFVRYAANHSPHEEWVYNGADVENDKVIWANSMGTALDLELRGYFRDRQAWIVEPDTDANGFLPFTAETAAVTP
jgi:hypothetical protein